MVYVYDTSLLTEREQREYTIEFIRDSFLMRIIMMRTIERESIAAGILFSMIWLTNCAAGVIRD